MAAGEGAVEVVKFLGPLTNNLNATNSNGCSAMHYAALWGKIEILKFLAPLIVDPNIKRYFWRYSN